jgi:hypothetical protein
MDEGHDRDDTGFGVVIRAKVSVISTVAQWSGKVAEEQFKQDRFDRLPEVLKIIQEESQRIKLVAETLPPLIEQ